MRGRKPEKFELKPKDKVYLHRRLRNGRTPLRIARRAQILLQRADRRQRVGVWSAKVDQNAPTTWRICQRYREAGLEAALYDAPRPGRPRLFSQRPAQTD